jgi:hypothetical protein
MGTTTTWPGLGAGSATGAELAFGVREGIIAKDFLLENNLHIDLHKSGLAPSLEQ